LKRALIKEDLPALDLPRMATSGYFGGGRSARLKTLFTNSALLNIPVCGKS
jgi:hypothetical protein